MKRFERERERVDSLRAMRSEIELLKKRSKKQKTISIASVVLIALVITLVNLPVFADSTTGTCLPISKGGTSCDTEATVNYLKQKLVDLLYPVGHILITTDLATPAQVNAKYGGTWVSYGTGRTLVGVGNNGTTNYTVANSTGGVDSVTLTSAQMPKHTHTFSGADLPAHWHGIYMIQPGYSQTIPTNRHFLTYGSAAGQSVTWTTTARTDGNNTQNLIVPTSAGTPQGENSLTGGDTSHENRMPYITTYMYRRTN